MCKWGRVQPIMGERSAAEAELLAETEHQIREYLAGERRTFDLPLRIRGTEFQKAVWFGAVDVPYGSTISYGELARRIGRPGAVRAVGTALGANSLHIIIPCHRIVSATSIGGYAAGLPIKNFLLGLESAVIYRDFGRNNVNSGNH